ncbi:hypothetical protein [Mangrovimonas cancribranchiae]|uniref:Uncharacterized protein n=1 Tax=Mangrovimonas cancribranchiae TaxID=3080055 RepID=A0AAU6P9E6_9FLAO
MHNDILELAFNKAKKDTGTETITRLSTYLSDKIQEISNEPFGERRLRDLLRKVKAEEPIELRPHVLKSLCQYLGYTDYEGYIKGVSKTTQVKPRKLTNKRTWIVVVFFILGALSIIIYQSVTKQRWMVWVEDHYEEVDFDTKKYELKQLKLYKEERILRFKLIKNPNCNTTFFNEDGSPKVWYHKTKNGNVELFTSHGLHPKTGNTLRPISTYMINKYFSCP